MYEDNAPAWRRLLLIAMSVIVIIAVLWLAVWLLFFHHGTSKPTPSPRHNSGQQAQHGNSNGSSATPKSGSATPGATGGSASQPAAPATTPGSGQSATSSSQLANAGPGEVLIPVAIAAGAGSALYYLRLWRKAGPRL